MPISPRQQRVFNFIRGYIASNEEAPTIAEIGEQFGMSSPASVHEILVTLEKENLIKRARYAHRGIQIVNQPVAPMVGWMDR